MHNMKYLLYVADQSSKPLVNSIEEAKRYASLHMEHKLSLRIECYSAPTTACIWTYDYGTQSWRKTADYRDTNLCCMAAKCQS
jgi:hypothetical protein